MLQTLGSDTGNKKKIWVSTCPPRTDSLVILLLQGKTKHEKQTSPQSGWSASCKVVLCLTFLKKHLHSSCSSFSYYLSKLWWTFLLHQKQLWEITQNVVIHIPQWCERPGPPLLLPPLALASGRKAPSGLKMAAAKSRYAFIGLVHHPHQFLAINGS